MEGCLKSACSPQLWSGVVAHRYFFKRMMKYLLTGEGKMNEKIDGHSWQCGAKHKWETS